MWLLFEYLFGVGYKVVGVLFRDLYGKILVMLVVGMLAAARGAKLCRRLRLDVERVTVWDYYVLLVVDVL